MMKGAAKTYQCPFLIILKFGLITILKNNKLFQMCDGCIMLEFKMNVITLLTYFHFRGLQATW